MNSFKNFKGKDLNQFDTLICVDINGEQLFQTEIVSNNSNPHWKSREQCLFRTSSSDLPNNTAKIHLKNKFFKSLASFELNLFDIATGPAHYDICMDNSQTQKKGRIMFDFIMNQIVKIQLIPRKIHIKLNENLHEMTYNFSLRLLTSDSSYQSIHSDAILNPFFISPPHNNTINDNKGIVLDLSQAFNKMQENNPSKMKKRLDSTLDPSELYIQQQLTKKIDQKSKKLQTEQPILVRESSLIQIQQSSYNIARQSSNDVMEKFNIDNSIVLQTQVAQSQERFDNLVNLYQNSQQNLFSQNYDLKKKQKQKCLQENFQRFQDKKVKIIQSIASNKENFNEENCYMQYPNEKQELINNELLWDYQNQELGSNTIENPQIECEINSHDLNNICFQIHLWGSTNVDSPIQKEDFSQLKQLKNPSFHSMRLNKNKYALNLQDNSDNREDLQSSHSSSFDPQNSDCNDKKLIGECSINLNKFYREDFHTYEEEEFITGQKVKSIKEKISNNGIIIGQIESSFFIFNDPFLRQMVGGVCTEEGIKTARSIFLQKQGNKRHKLQMPSQIKSLNICKENLNDCIFFLFEKEKKNLQKEKEITEIITKQLDLIKNCSQQKMCLYPSKESLILAQQIIIDLANDMIHQADFLDEHLRDQYYECLVTLLN